MSVMMTPQLEAAVAELLAVEENLSDSAEDKQRRNDAVNNMIAAFYANRTINEAWLRSQSRFRVIDGGRL